MAHPTPIHLCPRCGMPAYSDRNDDLLCAECADEVAKTAQALQPMPQLDFATLRSLWTERLIEREALLKN